VTFRDRTEAGRQLADALLGYRYALPFVLALPRGGVPVAAQIADRLNAPLDVIIVRKIGLPEQPELAMGALVEGDPPIVLKNQDVISAASVSPRTFSAAEQRELVEARRRRRLYRGDRQPIDIGGHTAIVVDDGMATGATMRVALAALRGRHPLRTIVAVPIASSDAAAIVRREADHLVCLEEHRDFGAIGTFYDDFPQVSDRDVIEALQRSARRIIPSRGSGH